jgi:hypothetical protein
VLEHERIRTTLVVLLGASEAARALATAPTLPGGVIEVAHRVLAGCVLDAAGAWLPPRPPSYETIEDLQRTLRLLTRPS